MGRKPKLKNTEVEYLKAVDRELEHRKKLGTSLRAYAKKAQPDFEWYRHCQVLEKIYERVVLGELKRVMVFEPRRHGKSEISTRLFPGYYLHRVPSGKVGICSYAAELAQMLSRSALMLYSRAGLPVDPDISSKTNWQTLDGGEVWAVGVGGPIVGKGYTLGIIDDPIKGPEEAYSELEREKQKDWYRSIFYPAREPNAAIIVIQTRWHEDDLAGWLLSEEQNEPQHWHIVNFEAVKTDEPIIIPETCTLEPDWRLAGEALCPERYDLRALESIRKTIGETWWNAQYQQRPTTQGGDIWRKEWFREYSDAPILSNVGYDWDLAYTKDQKNSACAYVKSGIDSQGNMYVMDFGFRWFEFPAQMKWMEALVGPHYVEKKASGKSIVQSLLASGVFAREVPVKGIEWTERAQLASPQVQNGRVFIHRPIRDRLLNDGRQGLLLVPNGSHNDVNDAFVQALNRHFQARRGAKLMVK